MEDNIKIDQETVIRLTCRAVLNTELNVQDLQKH
jgi:hypothetical protein